MNKSLWYTFFKLGKIPYSVLSVLENEKILISDEGIKSSFVVRNLKTPGRYATYKKRWFSGALVITEKRIIAFSFTSVVINTGFEQPEILFLTVENPSSSVLKISFDISDFKEKSSGKFLFTFNTEKAEYFFNIFNKKINKR